MRLWLAMLVVAWSPASLAADVVLDQRFDGPRTSWQLQPSPHTRKIAQRRTQIADTNQQRAIEQFMVATAAGYAAHVRHPVQQLPVLDELRIEVVQRSNRMGLQLAAEVVFPRSLDQTTGQPLRTLVFGDRYTTPGTWQRLELSNLPQLTKRQSRLMSAGPGSQVDERQAYVDHVVLVVPGGPGESNVQIDQLLVRGVVAPSEPPNMFDGPSLSSASGDGPMLSPPQNRADAQEKNFAPLPIRRQGTTLMVAGNPFLPRAVEYRGEPFESIAELGFNTVVLSTTPTEAQLLAASSAKLWVICPPPAVDLLADIPVDSVWQTVLAWSLGLENTGQSLDHIASQAEAIRRDDPLERPILVGAATRTRRFAQQVDVLVQPEPIPLIGEATNSIGHQRVPILGCSPWSDVAIGWSSLARWQAQALAPHGRHLGWHDPWKIRQAMLNTLATGSRGLLVRTHAKLGGSSPAAKRLENQLLTINREISAVEPWLATGKANHSAGSLRTGCPHVTWHLGRSRLLFLPASLDEGEEAVRPASLVIAGAAEDSQAHLLTPAGLVPLKINRVAGGLQVQLPRYHSPRWVVLTDDRRLLSGIKSRLNDGASELAQTSRTLAMNDVMELESLQGQLSRLSTIHGMHPVSQMKRQMQQCDQLLAAGDYARALSLSQTLQDQAARQRAAVFRQVTAGPGFQSIATMHELRLLPTHESLGTALFSLPRSGNLLAGGDFENLEGCQRAGWQHHNYADSHHECSVRFSHTTAHHGQACLKMTSRPTSQALLNVHSNPNAVVWVTSPELTVSYGSIVEITGWVRVVESADSRGRLIIQDSLGGEELALHIPTTTGWQPFRMIRMVDASKAVQLHLALAGSVTAEIDAMMVRTISRPTRSANQATPAELK